MGACVLANRGFSLWLQRGGEGNVHRDAGAQTTHKGLADKLKDKMFKKSEK